MIVPSEITQFYNKNLPMLKKLKYDVDADLDKISKRFDGFYESNIKPLESLAQKIESGIVKDPNDVIDLFRATIVVATRKDIEKLKNVMKEVFIIDKVIENRKKKPSDFVYDDLHLYIKYKMGLIMPGKDYRKRAFELQIKTFLQHGWAKSTRDILYKGSGFSWKNHRIASQIKAMLEQSDDVLAKIEKISDICPDNDYQEFKEKSKIVDIVENKWDGVSLPQDKISLCENIYSLLRYIGKNSDFLKRELDKTENLPFIKARSITPYQAVLCILIKNDCDKLVEALKWNKKYIFISQSMIDLLGSIEPHLEYLRIKV